LHAPTDKVHNRAFNVGVPGENFRIREIAEIVRDTVPNSEVSFAPDASPDTRNYRVDCSLIQRQVPEYQPQWNVRKGAQELLDAYKATGLTLEEFEGKRYKRIDHVRMLIADGVIDDSLRHI
jgi:nucleoside-diphosphate-sugar epimerase